MQVVSIGKCIDQLCAYDLHNHEAGGNTTFTHSQSNSEDSKTSEVGTSCKAAQEDCPTSYVQALLLSGCRKSDVFSLHHKKEGVTDHPLSDREALQSPVLGPFKCEIRDIEEGTIRKAVSTLHARPKASRISPKQVVLRSRQVGVGLDTQD